MMLVRRLAGGCRRRLRRASWLAGSVSPGPTSPPAVQGCRWPGGADAACPVGARPGHQRSGRITHDYAEEVYLLEGEITDLTLGL